MKFLAERGADVITSGRNMERGQKYIDGYPDSVKAHVTLLRCDLADMKSVEEFAVGVQARWDRFDGLVNNAGGAFLASDPNRTLHIGGKTYCAAFVGNHVGPFHLTNLLLPLLEANKEARIVNVSSFMHDNYAGTGAKSKQSRINFDDIHARNTPIKTNEQAFSLYGQSKLANVIHANELQKRYASKGINAYSLHPGFIDSRFGRGFGVLMMAVLRPVMVMLKCAGGNMAPMSGYDGAQTSLHCLLSEDAKKHGGKYFSQIAMIGHSDGSISGWPLGSANPEAKDEAIAARLWDMSAEMVAELKAAAK